MIDTNSESCLNIQPLETNEDISFSAHKKLEESTSTKVWVKNLPKGISESGIRNLFLTVGKPLAISMFLKNDSALVEFATRNEAELAVRDLDNKPPYDFQVRFHVPSKSHTKKSSGEEKESDFSIKFESHSFGKPPYQNLVDDKTKEESKNREKLKKQIENFITTLGYDPSIRMRQKRLDFKTEGQCVSLGRGYIYMGMKDLYVHGLEKFVSSSEECKSKEEMIWCCDNCHALTTKICANCSAPHCSNLCLNDTHGDCSLNRLNGRVNHIKNGETEIKTNYKSMGLMEAPLKSGCTVVISTYLTMKTVFVRRIDDFWEEEFSRLCNDVAAVALEEKKLNNTPMKGDLVIARYQEDLCFYRARVCSLQNDKASVFFLDFGNSQETSLDDLRRLPENLKLVPALAVKVELSDVSDSSHDSVNYFNKLTAEGIPLLLKFKNYTREVILTDTDSREVVNEKVAHLALPSWKKDNSISLRLGDVFYLDSLRSQNLEIGAKFSFIITHFDEKEFLTEDVFWATALDTDDFFHVNSEMYLKVREYCEFLEGDCYLPRDNELCLAKEKGEWHRCINLKSHKTTCWLFFVDDGHSSFVETRDIRKMIIDFIEAPCQAICCTLPDSPKLKTDEKYKSKVIEYMKSVLGQTINDVEVVKQMGDAYCLSIPDLVS